jgi:GNAT superfamily N-acetyltransferase
MKSRLTMRIVQATLEHLDQLTPLFVNYRELFGQLPYPDSSRSFLEKRISRKESVIYLAMADEEDKILGFCQLYPSFSSLSLKRVWILNDIYVCQDARRQLVADRLIQAAKQMAKDTNAVRLRVASSINNTVAHKVYESIGFVEDTEYKNFVLPIGEDPTAPCAPASAKRPAVRPSGRFAVSAGR